MSSFMIALSKHTGCNVFTFDYRRASLPFSFPSALPFPPSSSSSFSRPFPSLARDIGTTSRLPTPSVQRANGCRVQSSRVPMRNGSPCGRLRVLTKEARSRRSQLAHALSAHLRLDSIRHVNVSVNVRCVT